MQKSGVRLRDRKIIRNFRSFDKHFRAYDIRIIGRPILVIHHTGETSFYSYDVTTSVSRFLILLSEHFKP